MPPVYDIAGAIRPQDTVGDFYQGKALRAQIAAQEKTTDLMDEELAVRQQNADTSSGNLQMRVEEYARGVSKDLREMESEKRERLTSGARAAAAWFDENPDDIEGATAQFAIGSGFDPDELRGQFGTIEPHEAYGLVAAEDYEIAGEPTADEQFINNLNVSDAEKDRLKLAIARKKGTITGTTEFDPSSSVNASGQSRNTIEYQDATIGAVGAVQLGTELVKVSESNPEALGVPGSLMRFGSNLVSGAKAIADWAGYENVSAEDQEKQNIGASAFDYGSVDEDKLGVSGAEAEKFRAGVYGIAFAAAVAEQGTRPTDKDIQQFIDQIGGRATSAQSFRATIFQFMRRQDRRLKTIADVKQISDVDEAAALSAWTPAYHEFVETYAKSAKLKTATDPNTGQRFIELSLDNWEEF